MTTEKQLLRMTSVIKNNQLTYKVYRFKLKEKHLNSYVNLTVKYYIQHSDI